MYLLTISGRNDEGVYTVVNEYGDSVLYIFEEEDDASRYAMMLEDVGYPEMEVVEIEDELLMKACEIHDYRYAIITPDDIVIPPEDHDLIS